jgi:methyl-accepting chemotaxis protein
MRWSIGNRLACGFAALVLLIIAPAAAVHWGLGCVRQSQHQLLDAAQPALTAATNLQDGLHQALASEHFERQRAEGWQRAEQNLAAIRELAVQWTPEERVLVERLTAEIGDIRAIHEGVAPIVQKTESTQPSPGLTKLVNQTSPLGQRMLAAVNAMIDIELKLEKTHERTRLLQEMHALRDSLHASLVELHSYLATAESSRARAFDQRWKDNDTIARTLRGKENWLTAEQVEQLATFVGLRTRFQTMSKELFALRPTSGLSAWPARSSPQADVREAQASALAGQLIAMQEGRSQQAERTLRSQSATLAVFAIGLPATAVILGIYIGWRVTRQVSRPLRHTAAALQSLAAGERIGPLEVESEDELGQMAQAINTLAEARTQPAGFAESAQSELNPQRLRAFVNAEVSRRKPHFRPRSQPAATVSGDDHGFHGELAAHTERLAHSSDQLQAQAAQLTQLMGRLQSGAIQTSEPQQRQIAHEAQPSLAGPKAPVAAKQLVPN